MNLIDENLKLKLIKGSPLLLKKTNAFFQHKTVGEIIDFDYTEFLRIFHFFTLSEEDLLGNEEIPGMTVFFYFLLLLNNDNKSNFSQLIQTGLNFFLGATNLKVDLEKRLLFFDYKEVKDIELNEEGFKELVEYVNIVYNGNLFIEKDEEQDLSEAERRMKEKFDRLRKEREAAKNKKGGNKRNKT